MDRVVPWREFCARIDPVYPKAGHGRPPVGLERMLRMYFLQHWFNLSDPAVEEALYDSPTMRALVGIDLGREPMRAAAYWSGHRGAIVELNPRCFAYRTRTESRPTLTPSAAR